MSHTDEELAVIADFIESLGGHPLTGKGSVVFLRMADDASRSDSPHWTAGFPVSDETDVRVGKILYRLPKDETMLSHLSMPFRLHYINANSSNLPQYLWESPIRNILVKNISWFWKPTDGDLSTMSSSMQNPDGYTWTVQITSVVTNLLSAFEKAWSE